MLSRIHNTYHAWVSHVLGCLVYLGHINPEEHFALMSEGDAQRSVQSFHRSTRRKCEIAGLLPQTKIHQVS